MSCKNLWPVQERVYTGDHVTFHIANSAAAAKQAEKLGASVSKLVGKHLIPKQLDNNHHPYSLILRAGSSAAIM